jgi:hypothetical protein
MTFSRATSSLALLLALATATPALAGSRGPGPAHKDWAPRVRGMLTKPRFDSKRPLFARGQEQQRTAHQVKRALSAAPDDPRPPRKMLDLLRATGFDTATFLYTSELLLGGIVHYAVRVTPRADGRSDVVLEAYSDEGRLFGVKDHIESGLLGR